MPVNYSSSPGTPRTRLERLLRERELRKFSKFSNPNEEIGDAIREAELFGNDSLLTESDWFLNGEEGLMGADVFEWQDGRPAKQRLLVVANRLPVSAVRKGKESWHLEISAGGLVSALLGRQS